MKNTSKAPTRDALYSRIVSEFNAAFLDILENGLKLYQNNSTTKTIKTHVSGEVSFLAALMKLIDSPELLLIRPAEGFDSNNLNGLTYTIVRRSGQYFEIINNLETQIDNYGVTCLYTRFFNISLFSGAGCLRLVTPELYAENEILRSETFSSVFGSYIEQIYMLYIGNDIKTFQKLFNNFVDGLWGGSLPKRRSRSERLLDGLQAIKNKCSNDDFEDWLRYFAARSCLEQLIVNVGEKDCTIDNVSILFNHWETKQFRQIFNLADIQREAYLLTSGSSTDSWKRVLNKALQLVLPHHFPCQITPPSKFLKHLPATCREEISRFTSDNIHQLETLRGLCFTLHCLATTTPNDINHESIDDLFKLWHLIVDNFGLVNLVKDYLKLWNHDTSLYLRQEWLMAWFLITIPTTRTHYSYANNGPVPFFSQNGRLEYISNLSTVALYIIFWIRHLGCSEDSYFCDVKKGYEAFVSSFIYMLCEYSHIDCELPRQLPLRNSMRTIWEHQSLLYTIQDTYRDHLHHVIEVCLLGLYFLSMKSEDDTVFFGLFQARDMRCNLRNWMVASLLHDIGYVMKFQSNPIKYLSFLGNESIVRFRMAMQGAFDQNKTKFSEQGYDYLRKILPDFPVECCTQDFDHGVVSALHIFDLCDIPGTNLKEEMATSAEAAAYHNLSNVTLSTKKPLSFLLFLCDNLQEWDRPFLKGDQLRASLLIQIVKERAGRLHTSISFVDFLILKGIRLSDDLSCQAIGPLECILSYRNSNDANFYPPTAWIGHTKNLQRLECCSIQISIVQHHPHDTSEHKFFHIDLFHNFIASQISLGKSSDYGVLNQWAFDARTNIHWFKYFRESAPISAEGMRYDLFDTGDNKPITRLPDKYIEQYLGWLNNL